MVCTKDNGEKQRVSEANCIKTCSVKYVQPFSAWLTHTCCELIPGLLLRKNIMSLRWEKPDILVLAQQACHAHG